MSAQDTLRGKPEAPAAADAAAPLVVTDTLETGVGIITLANPGARNALSMPMMSALQEALDHYRDRSDIRVIVLAAQGPVFCAGHDLKELTARRSDADAGRAFYAETMRACSALMLSIVRCPKPVIAAVQGTATAAGCQLVASCDLAVAAASVFFCTPGVNIGLFCSTPMVALSRNVSRKQAMEMLLLGNMIEAGDAMAWGLVNRVVERHNVLPEAMGMAKAIVAKPGATLALGKDAFYKQMEMTLQEAYDFAATVMVDNMLMEEACEGIGAFLEKRPPNWSGSLS